MVQLIFLRRFQSSRHSISISPILITINHISIIITTYKHSNRILVTCQNYFIPSVGWNLACVKIVDLFHWLLSNCELIKTNRKFIFFHVSFTIYIYFVNYSLNFPVVRCDIVWWTLHATSVVHHLYLFGSGCHMLPAWTKKNWNFVRFGWKLFHISWQNKNLPVCWLLWRVRIPELSECFVWWTWCRGCRGRWSCSQSCHHPAGSCDSDPGSTNQKSILFCINQSEVSNKLNWPIRKVSISWPIRSKYRLTNKKWV